MGIEIEKKFLLNNDEWKKEAGDGEQFRQGYMSGSNRSSVRIRVAGDKANINIKSATLGVTRKEYEYEIPVEDANEMLDSMCERPFIEKRRFFIKRGPHTWEIDVFEGDNEGLIVAEIELKDPDEPFDIPGWIGEDVSEDPKYYNVCLVNHPYKDW
ncbi:MAG: CYTH domain-containing protein [Gammaproteobacteria bacterium]|nr:MAG: CYTH domain-containing protein [Gammaproteobacteria bacterium]